jgi:hypothetical protein
MKKIFLVAGILFTTTTGTFAHTTINRKDRKETRIERKKTRKELRTETRAENDNEVSDFTGDQFAKDFPDAKNVQFVKKENFDEIDFVSGKEMLSAYYDYKNELVGTIQKKTFADLPENAQNEILKKYAGYNIDGVVKFNDNDSNETDMIVYGTSIDDADNYFVELKNDSNAIVVKVGLPGEVSFFTNIK